MCQFACVYGLDGNQWAASPGFQLAKYEIEIAGQKLPCDEHAALVKGATEGSRKPQECGYRICNQKYMFLRNDEDEGVKFVVLSRQGGGGAVAAVTGKALVVGVYGKDAPTSVATKFQNVGDTTFQVLGVAKQLLAAGY